MKIEEVDYDNFKKSISLNVGFDLLDLIDEYRYKNKIQSRAEAIRTIVKIFFSENGEVLNE